MDFERDVTARRLAPPPSRELGRSFDSLEDQILDVQATTCNPDPDK
jgi:hypothetical protein